MINLIPMAGLGTRFTNKGYKLSKPLISVSCMPMIIKVIRDLPPADKWIFVMRQEHIDYGVDKLIKKELPDAVLLIDPNPLGQATSCMVAKDYLNNNEELLVAACDGGLLYNKEKFEELKKRPDADCIIWTLTQREILRKNPTAWGWYKLDSDNETIKDISIKVPVSDDPYYDHSNTATFYFKKAQDFVDSINLMIKEDYKIDNEFYVDAVPKFLQKLNKKTIIFDIDLYVGWGKPEDLHDYERIEFIVKYNIIPSDITEEEKRLLPLWKKYFEK